VDRTLDRSGKISKSLLPIIVGLIVGTSSLSQHLNRPDDQPYDLKVPVELVLVPVTVEDKEGKPIYFEVASRVRGRNVEEINKRRPEDPTLD
jgi:hypothetical protein